MTRRCRPCDEGGLAAVEFVLLVPVLLIFLGLAVVGGRVAKTDLELQSAARAAARAASMQRTAAGAVTAAQHAAQTELASAGVTCHSYTIEVVPGGPGGVDHTHLSCVVPIGGVDLVGVGPSKTMTADFSSPVDTFRQFGP
jgi:Flp pilus assembly protein TadG